MSITTPSTVEQSSVEQSSVEQSSVEQTSVEQRTVETGPPIGTGRAPTVAERWLVPLMWLAIGIVTVMTTPAPVGEPPAYQAAIGELLGWAALVSLVGMVAAAVAGRASLRLWSFGLGVVGLVGLWSCQMFGHPVLSTAWGLSQVVLVTGGLGITARLAARR